jgi:low temperature requirement protein LtrA
MNHQKPKSQTLLRKHGGPLTAKVSMVELFFDLVFVFAITQLSHALLADLTLNGTLRSALLLLAVWSLWNYNSWATNLLDPDRLPVKLIIFVLMFVGLIVSVSIPVAFGTLGNPNGGAWAFGCSYVLMHAIRTSFILWAARNEPLNRRQNFLRNFFWVIVSGVFWLMGAAANVDQRLYWWIAAIGIEFFSPWLLYWTPFLGASKTTDWIIDGAHMAERCALFVIIALGESLLITGATFSSKPFTIVGALGAASAFLSTLAMWWIYFHAVAEHATKRIKQDVDPGRTAMVAYSYIHITIVAAVGSEIAIVHPDHADTAAIATIIGGAALFLFGCLLFKWFSYDRKTPPLSHGVGLLLLALLCFSSLKHWFTTAQLGALTAAVMFIVAAWETVALSRPKSAFRSDE